MEKHERKGLLDSTFSFIERQQERKDMQKAEEQRQEEEKRRRVEEAEKAQAAKRQARIERLTEKYPNVPEFLFRIPWLIVISFIVLIVIALSPLILFRSPSQPETSTRSFMKNPPASSSMLEGEDYRDVVMRFENAGFTNIETEPMGDLITGWVNKDGSVAKVSIAGETSFGSSSEYPPDALVRISYHSYPQSDPETDKDSSGLPAESEEASEAAAAAGTAEEISVRSDFPVENAIKAVVTAFTNLYSDDVWADGFTYDPALFHSYDYSGPFRMVVTDEGDWSAVDENTWHAELMYLYFPLSDQLIKISCDVLYDGSQYVLNHVRYMSAAPRYIESEDGSKTSGWETIEPGESYPMLTLDKKMVELEREARPDDEIVLDEYIDHEEWVQGQFSFWDGSHYELKDLIKDAINDEKSFSHIKTEYIEISDLDRLMQVNQMLSSAGSSERVEIDDLFIITEFSAKNEYNATIKYKAFGISSFRTKQTTLVAIE